VEYVHHNFFQPFNGFPGGFRGFHDFRDDWVDSLPVNQTRKVRNAAALQHEFTTELRFPAGSEFFGVIEAALEAKGNCLDEPLSVYLKPGGYRRDVEVMIDPGNSTTFFTNWKSTDSSRFSSRLRAAAAVLQRCGLVGRIRLTHDDGHVTIQRS
jgi:hypothetical protein